MNHKVILAQNDYTFMVMYTVLESKYMLLENIFNIRSKPENKLLWRKIYGRQRKLHGQDRKMNGHWIIYRDRLSDHRQRSFHPYLQLAKFGQ